MVIGNSAYCRTKMNTVIDTRSVMYGKTRSRPGSFSSFTAEAELRMQSEVKPAPEIRNNSSSFAENKASIQRLMAEPAKRIMSALAGAACLFNLYNAEGMLLSRARA